MELNIKDMTINESGGNYEAMKILMESSSPVAIEKWMLETEFGIVDNNDDSYGVLQFWNTGECVLNYYQSNFTNDYSISDLSYLYNWLKDRGWNLSIDEDLRSVAVDFWDSFDNIISDEEYVDEEIDYDDDEDENVDFVEYKNRDKVIRKVKSNKYDLTNELPEFKDHKYDFGKRSDRENNSKF